MLWKWLLRGFEKNPELVLDFYNQRRKQLLEVHPNQAHIALAELEKNTMLLLLLKMWMTCMKERVVALCYTSTVSY